MAGKMFKKAIEEDSTSALAFSNLGGFYMDKMPNCPAAEQLLRKAELWYDLVCTQALQEHLEKSFETPELALKPATRIMTGCKRMPTAPSCAGRRNSEGPDEKVFP